MAYLKRKMDGLLAQWLAGAERKPLIVNGARQIGKTESIRRFAREHYEQVIEINFVTEPLYKGIIADGFRTRDIIRNISRIDPEKRFTPGRTLLFFDELQEFPEIATALKFFREDGRYDVICSGSLLGIQYRRIESISVGNKTDLLMRSMDFEEFLWAKGHQDAADELLEKMCRAEPLSELEMRVYQGLFLDYCILGGMPAVVRDYVAQDSFAGSTATQREIIADYKEDIRKYAEGLDQGRIMQVFNRIVPQLGAEHKKFQISKVAKGARFKDYFGCIDWLVDAGIVNRCSCLRFPELPLRGNYDENKYKLYVADTGLLVAMLDDEEQDDLRANRNLGVYKGALYENFAAEALVKQGYDLYYYKREDGKLEQDFFIRSAGELIPVEIKANTNQAKSLRQLIQSERYPDIAHGLKFTTGNIGVSGPVQTFPHFCLFLLKRYMARQQIFC